MSNLAKKYAQALFELTEKLEDKKDIEVIVDKFVKQLFKDNRVSQTKQIMKYFVSFWNEHKKITEVHLISAQKLDEVIVSFIKKYIKEKTNSQDIELTEEVRPSIKGGIIIYFNGKVLDLSLENKLNKLKNSLNE